MLDGIRERHSKRRILKRQRQFDGHKSFWPGSSLRSKGLLVIAIPLVPVTAAMAMLVFQAREDKSTDLRVTAIREAHEASEHLLGAAIDAETGIRGYVATGNPVFLAPYDAVMKDLVALSEDFEAANFSSEAEHLLADQYLVLQTLRKDAGTASEAQIEALLLRGKKNMDAIRSVVATDNERRETELRTALAERERVNQRVDSILWFGMLSSVLGGAVGILLFAREIANRVRLLAQNSRALDQRIPLAPIRGRDEIAALGATLEETKDKLAQKDTLRREAELEIIRARDEADRANAAKSEFLSRMSHELRTPLNAILGFAQLLEMDELRPDQIDSVRHIVGGGTHLLDLINEVLDISRIETGQLPLSVEPVALRPLIDECVALVDPLAAAKAVRLRGPVSSELDETHVFADRKRLKQVILNLVSNAIKYNREGGSVDLAISQSADQLRVEFRDTGPGLTPEQLDSLFMPFNRLGAEATSVEGTGLGLALSKGLAQAMGADISVSSEVGCGSVFSLTLRRAEDPAGATQIADPDASFAVIDPRARLPKVLYIEDNLSNLTLVQRIMAHRPLVGLITATDGRGGIELARSHQPDLVLLDLNLPDIEGDEVLHSLRSDDRTSSIPVIIISADASSGQIARLKAGGALDYITKPLDVRRFLAAVDGALAEVVR